MTGKSAPTGGSAAVGAANLDHVGLVVPDLDQAVAFFSEVFGARLVFRMDRFIDPTGAASRRLGAKPGSGFALAMLAWGDHELELLQWWPAGEARGSEPDAVGTAHVAVGVPDVSAALDVLRSVPGVEIIGEPVTFTEGPTPGLTNAFARAPWGLLIELMQWPA